jgi:HPt (histidine-containing phosphotransfer) domain-containing protein
MGNARKYRDLLHRFVESSLEQMMQFKSDDQSAVRRLAHTFKGTAATLGLDQLARLAAVLEQSLREHETQGLPDHELQEAMQGISQELISLAAALSAPVGTTQPPDAAPMDPEALNALLDNLDRLLSQNDTRAIVLIDQHGAMLRAALGAPGAEMVKLVQSFEFEPAHQLLQSLRSMR